MHHFCSHFKRIEIDDAFWEETYICSVLRAVNDPPRVLRPLRIKDVLTDIVSETRFLSTCADHFWDGELFFLQSFFSYIL